MDATCAYRRFRKVLVRLPCVYVLRGASGKRYVGITNDLPRRLREHASRNTKAGQMLGDFALIYSEEYPGYTAARHREKFLKSGQGRKWLDELESRTRTATDP